MRSCCSLPKRIFDENLSCTFERILAKMHFYKKHSHVKVTEKSKASAQEQLTCHKNIQIAQ